jgi:hypothetical protein
MGKHQELPDGPPTAAWQPAALREARLQSLERLGDARGILLRRTEVFQDTLLTPCDV